MFMDWTQVSGWYGEGMSSLQVLGVQSWGTQGGGVAARVSCQGISWWAASQKPGVDSEWKAASRHIHGGLVAGSGAVTSGLWFGGCSDLEKGLERESLGLSSEGTGVQVEPQNRILHGVGVRGGV